MMTNENTSFTAMDENGNEVKCEALFTFFLEETGKNYIVYSDDSVDENGHTRVFASTYDPDIDSQKLIPITSDREWEIIGRILNELQAGS